MNTKVSTLLRILDQFHVWTGSYCCRLRHTKCCLWTRTVCECLCTQPDWESQTVLLTSPLQRGATVTCQMSYIVLETRRSWKSQSSKIAAITCSLHSECRMKTALTQAVLYVYISMNTNLYKSWPLLKLRYWDNTSDYHFLELWKDNTYSLYVNTTL